MIGKNFCASVGAAVLTLFAMTGSVFAQEPTAIAVTIPTTLDWSDAGSQIMAALSPAITAGIGVALAVWICVMAIRVLKRSAS